MIHFPHADALCALPHPYALDSVPVGLFDKAMAEISLFHSHHTPGYEHWLNANGLSVDDLEHLIVCRTDKVAKNRPICIVVAGRDRAQRLTGAVVNDEVEEAKCK